MASTDIIPFVDLSVSATRKATVANIVAGSGAYVSGGALGTPSSGTLTNCTGLPVAGITASTSTALGVGSIELGHASDTTLSRSSAGVLAVEGVVVPTISSTSTLTNKTINLTSNTLIATSAQLATAVTDETGSGSLVFATAPTLATVNMNNTDIQNIRLAEFNGEYDNGNSSTADTIDWGQGNFQKSTLTGNCTYTFTAPSGPARLTLRILTGSGSFAVTWPASVKWSGGTAPTITTTASKADLVTFWYDGSAYYGTYTQNYTP